MLRDYDRPEFEKPPKPPHVKLVEGCLLLILFAIVVGAGLAVLLSLFPGKK